MGNSPVEAQIRDRLLESHRDLLTDTVAVGHSIAEASAGPVTDGAAVRLLLERTLEQHGLLTALLQLLDTGATVIGQTIQGQPVPAPPYLTVTSTGPLCRGTLQDGRRLLIHIDLFAVDSGPTQYRFLDCSVERRLRVRLQQ